MKDKLPLVSMGIYTARDLCVLDPNPPPLSFLKDLNLPPHPQPVNYKSPEVDTKSYWQPADPHP